MIQTTLNILKSLLGNFKSHEQLVRENMELRQQIIVLQRSARKANLPDLEGCSYYTET
jgi:hypothetical protein